MRATPDSPRDTAPDPVPPDDPRLAAHLRTLKRIHLGVAHDLRAPLNAALLNLELLRRALADPAGPEVVERRANWLQVVEKELARLRQALEALLVEFAPGSGVQDRFDLRELVHHLGRLLAAQARQQRIALSLEVPHGPVTVVADRDAVRQACLHLAVAALERAGAGGAVHVSLVVDEGREGAARVRVTGGGSAPVRLDPVARQIAEEQGGDVRTFERRGVTEQSGPGERDRPGVADGDGVELVLPLAGSPGAGTAGS